MSIVANAANGAILLDEYDPEWFRKINTETLDMSNEELCILGQLTGDYAYALDDLGIDWAPDYGFDFRSVDATVDNWTTLELAWIMEINNRRKLASV